ncbi:MAG TPA: TetR/AcrR family transcriptional regulator [Candidatus Aquilonibacter sp.]|nr:TetR/AcrR family transcriptional regulator [Candidatus Aquilonibacter sp.]
MTRSADARRRAELLEAIVDYVFEHGLSDLSLRPLADAVGASPRVLLYYFGPSKSDLIQAIIAGVRDRQLRGFAAIRESPFGSPREACLAVWTIMTQPALGPLFRFFFELFGLALVDRSTYAAFLDHAIEDWLAFFSEPLIAGGVSRDEARARATIVLAGFRGFLMDLCATGDRERIDRAVAMWLDLIMPAPETKEFRHAQ